MARGAVLFDLDGTLVDSAQDIAVALSRLSRMRGGGAVSPDTVRPLVSLGAATLVARALGIAADDVPDALAAFRAILRELVPQPGCVYPHVHATLATLVDQGWRLAVVTNKPGALAADLLAALKLAPFFRAVVGGDTTCHPKPHAAPVLHALSALGAGPGDALFVGDSDVDAAAAAGLGIPFLLYTGGYGAGEVRTTGDVTRFDRYPALPGLLHALR